MNLEQAIAASCRYLACRVVGDRRVIIEHRRELLIIQIQRKSKRHWIIDDDGGGVRYLDGIMRDGIGRYVCILDDLSGIVRISAYLPLPYQSLLHPECGDWQTME